MTGRTSKGREWAIIRAVTNQKGGFLVKKKREGFFEGKGPRLKGGSGIEP